MFDEYCVFGIEGWDTTIAYNSFNRYKFEYWEIVDIPKVESTVSLPMCYEKVVKLFKNINPPSTI